MADQLRKSAVDLTMLAERSKRYDEISGDDQEKVGNQTLSEYLMDSSNTSPTFMDNLSDKTLQDLCGNTMREGTSNIVWMAEHQPPVEKHGVEEQVEQGPVEEQVLVQQGVEEQVEQGPVEEQVLVQQGVEEQVEQGPVEEQLSRFYSEDEMELLTHGVRVHGRKFAKIKRLLFYDSSRTVESLKKKWYLMVARATKQKQSGLPLSDSMAEIIQINKMW